VNRLLQENIPVYVTTEKIKGIPDGTFILKPGKYNLLKAAKEAGIPFSIISSSSVKKKQLKEISLLRIGIYQPWIPWVYDEGWTRLVFDNFQFPYKILHNEDLKNGKNLRKNFDVIIFGSENADWIEKGAPQDAKEPEVGQAILPDIYRGGIGKEGVRNLQEFLKDEGTLLFFGEANNFAIEKLRLPVVNVLKKTTRKEFFAPGTIVRIQLDKKSPLTIGMPTETAIYINNSLALSLKPYIREVDEVGKYPERDILQSGWLVGEKRIAGKVALADIPVYRGRVILYAFRPQHRGQTYGTFKLIFNALYGEKK